MRALTPVKRIVASSCLKAFPLSPRWLRVDGSTYSAGSKKELFGA